MKRLCIATGVFVIAIVIVWMVVDRPGPPEPEYKGQTLTEWLNRLTMIDLEGGLATNSPIFVTCQEAVVAMGTNAIPFLIDELQSENSKTKTFMARLANQRTIRKILPNTWSHDLIEYYVSDEEQIQRRHERAYRGFFLLGTNGASARPSLIKATQNTNPKIRCWSFFVFESTRPSKELYMPVVLRLLKDPDKTVQILAAGELSVHYPEEMETNKVYDSFPELRPAPTNQVSGSK